MRPCATSRPTDSTRRELNRERGITVVFVSHDPDIAERLPNNVSPTWSPDGRHIALFTDRNGKWDLYAMDADGSDQRPMLVLSPSALLRVDSVEGFETALRLRPSTLLRTSSGQA